MVALGLKVTPKLRKDVELCPIGARTRARAHTYTHTHTLLGYPTKLVYLSTLKDNESAVAGTGTVASRQKAPL